MKFNRQEWIAQTDETLVIINGKPFSQEKSQKKSYYGYKL
jgi:hypothetical protein